jgi:hypothetical protein
MQCSFVTRCLCFGGTHYLQFQGRTELESIMFQDYTTSQLRRACSSFAVVQTLNPTEYNILTIAPTTMEGYAEML